MLRQSTSALEFPHAHAELSTAMQVVANVSFALMTIGVSAVLAELQQHNQQYHASLLLLCDDLLKRSSRGGLQLDPVIRQLLLDIVMYDAVCLHVSVFSIFDEVILPLHPSSGFAHEGTLHRSTRPATVFACLGIEQSRFGLIILFFT